MTTSSRRKRARDGTRALTAAGRRSEALHHIEEHRGTGRRILDGRQVAVLARATTGDLPGALALLAGTDSGAPWEDAVTAVLTALCRRGDQGAAETAISQCLAFEPADGLAAFTTRLTLTALDTADPDTPSARNLLTHLTSRTSESGDGYALRDLLTHEGVRRRLDPTRGAALERALAACALGSATLPDTLRDRLEDALDHARGVLEKSPFDPGSPGGNPLERRIRTAPSSVTSAPAGPANSGE
ncbi:hypothetical protein ACFCX4_22355 [Kitasatospora sp. NPDC056327]|uniref:hypothetical protein n=1 Tax=Kitasatospora sp. NPDC056327 TaxID=3345785 RepID=UPI0035DBCDF2